jgi:glycosyltransferase involved in cell wall biosynthesis
VGEARVSGASAAGKTIGLAVIAKDAAPTILRCLESARPLVDYVLVQDMGSTDGTPALVRGYLDRERLRGAVVSEPWRDFGRNRSLALERLRQRKDVDYALVMDADEVIILDRGFDAARFKATLYEDAYAVELRLGALRYRRPKLFSNRRRFRYRGVLHEVIEGPDGGWSSGFAAGFHVLGSEAAGTKDPETARRDAAILERALRSEKDRFLRARYVFYLAMSYRDCGEKEKAAARFLERTTLGFWEQEIYWSFYSAALLEESLGRLSVDEILALYARASELLPTRAEALYAASRFCRASERCEEGYALAERGLAIPQPTDALYPDPAVYAWGLLDELAAGAFSTARYAECLDAAERIPRDPTVPEPVRERAERMARSARQKLAAGTEAAPAASPLRADLSGAA